MGVIVGIKGKRSVLKQFIKLKKSDNHLSCRKLRIRDIVDVRTQLKGYPCLW